MGLYAHVARIAGGLPGCRLPLHGPRWVDWSSPRLRRAAAIADRMGMTLHRWQLYVLAVAYEEGAGGLPLRHSIGVQVARQSGKTTLAAVVSLTAASYGLNGCITAQTRGIARVKWLEVVDCWRRAAGDPEQVQTVLANGYESAVYVPTGAVLRLTTPTDKGPRSHTFDYALVDEAAFVPQDFTDALGPTFATRPGNQLWLLSSAGDETSRMLAHYRQLGRDGADGHGWMEWALPDGADADDEANWPKAMPTLGERHGISWANARKLHADMTAAAWDREFMGRWPDGTAGGVLDMDGWIHGLTVEADARFHHPSSLVIGVAVDDDRDHGCIAAVSQHPDGTVTVELIDAKDGPSNWIPPRLLELSRRHRAPIAYDAKSPAGSMAPRLFAEKAEVIELGARQYARSCGLLADKIAARELRHLSNRLLNDAAGSVARRRLAQSWAWAQGNPKVRITALEAVTVALWGSATRKPLITPGYFTGAPQETAGV